MSAIAAGLALALVGAGAADASFVGSVSDPAGDVANPAHDIVAASVAYDRKEGTLVGSVRLRGAPASTDDAAIVSVVAGTRTPEGCRSYPAVGFSASTYRRGALWHAFSAQDAGRSGSADEQGVGTSLKRFEAESSRLRGRTPDCLVAILSPADDQAVVLDATEPVTLKREPRLGVRLRDVPRNAAPGRTRRVRVTLSNTGEAKTQRVRLKVSSARGLRATPSSRTVGPIRAGGSRTVTLRVALTSRAAATTRLRVTATAGSQRVRADGKISKRRSTSSGSGSASRDYPRLCNRIVPDLSGGAASLALVPC